MNTNREDEGRLRDILQSALQVKSYTGAMSYEAFLGDQRTQDAVLRRLEIMGEAAGRVSASGRESHPAIPFQRLKGLRNILVHDYGSVDLPLLWAAIHRDLPPLIQTLAPLFPMIAPNPTTEGEP